MEIILPQTFFKRDTITVARALLGTFLVARDARGKTRAYMITETEAYDGFGDKASHAHRGRTPRNDIMFGPGGYWYVYIVYGMHDMLNIVTGKKDYPAAVLIRGVEGVNGPGRLTRALGITRARFNTKPARKSAGLHIEDRGVIVPKRAVKTSPRIGVAYAGPVWSQKRYRFFIKCSV